MLLRVKGGHAIRRAAAQAALISLEEKKLPKYRSFSLSSPLPLAPRRTDDYDRIFLHISRTEWPLEFGAKSWVVCRRQR